MTTLSPDRLRHIAKLAHLSLQEREIETLSVELQAIVGYVEELSELDTSDVPPTLSVDLHRSEMRPDKRAAGLDHESALAAAPEVERGSFAVPAFVES